VQHYKVIADESNGPYRVTTAYYKYTLEDEHDGEILGYNWHPDGPGEFRDPHLHLGNAAQIGRPELESTKAHLPTGRVTLEDFVSLLIEGFDIEETRRDWKTILDNGASVFHKYRTW
jgi:hypothetical protein